MRRQLIFIIFFLLISSYVFSQNRTYYNKLKKSKKSSIEYSKSLLSSLQSDRKSDLDRLLLINQQIRKEQELVYILNKEMKLLDAELVHANYNLKKMREDLEHQKDEYAQLLQFTWQNMNVQNRMIYILSASDFNAAYRRIVYLRQLSDYRMASSLKIQKSLFTVDSTVSSLEKMRIEKNSLSMERKLALDSLKSIKASLNSLINKTDRRISDIKAEMQKNQQKREIVKKEVRKEINKSNVPSSSGKANRSAEKSNSKLTKSFKSMKRRHLWPLKKLVILHGFGDYHHPEFQQVIIKNDGIELGAKPNSTVHAIYNGKVISIVNIPGEGASIIIKHGDYYTVYTNVVGVEVESGTNVSTGQIIAKLRKEKKLAKMGFQLWYKKEKLNPILWLSRR